jgi:hypothetical protein
MTLGLARNGTELTLQQGRKDCQSIDELRCRLNSPAVVATNLQFCRAGIART